MSRAQIRTLVFDTTNAALWAEEVARDASIPVEVVPAPAGAKAKCDLALITPEDKGDVLSGLLHTHGVPHRIWRGGGYA